MVTKTGTNDRVDFYDLFKLGGYYWVYILAPLVGGIFAGIACKYHFGFIAELKGEAPAKSSNKKTKLE